MSFTRPGAWPRMARPQFHPSTYMSLLAPALALATGVALTSCGAPERTAESTPNTTPAAPTEATRPQNAAALIALSGSLSQATLVEAARQHNPTTLAVAAARRAAEARVAQAGVWANPELELAYGQTRPQVSGLDTDRPYGAQLKQRFEWWGKRRARVAAAAAQVAVVQAESATALLELEIDVRLAAIAYAASQAAANLATRQATVADELAAVVSKRQALGDINRGEAARIQLEATTARLHLDAANRAVEVQRDVLRAWCGEGIADDLTISDGLTDPTTGPDGAIRATSNLHPRVRAALEAERAAEARIAAERETRMPDMTVGIFGDREYEKDTLGLTLSFEVPVWDRNAAGIAEAEAERSQRAAQRLLATRTVERERLTALGEVTSTAATVIALRDQAIPVAAEMVSLRTTAFNAGDASVADVLEAQRAELAVQRELLEVRQRHAEALVRLLAATGPGATP